MPDQPVSIPESLDGLSDAQLHELEGQANAEFDALLASDDDSAEAVARLEAMADGIERLQGERVTRAEGAGERQAKRDQLRERLRPVATEAEPETPAEAEAPEAEQDQPADQPEPVLVEAETEAPEAIAAAAVNRMAEAFTTALERVQVREPAPSAASRLAEARRNQPTTPAPPARMAMTAGADIPSVPRGATLDDLDSLVETLQARARSLPISSTPGAVSYGQVPQAIVATGRNEFDNTLNVRGEFASPSEVMELHAELTGKDKAEALVAGGGWCAPSEIRYSFYEIGDSPATVDLPTFGVNRGGIQFPSSLSLKDIWDGASLSNSTTPFLWTETDDILTVTGSTNKPCVRVPCPTFTERRLELYGYCVTAGNLADDAYPEMTRQYLRNLLLAFEHVKNFRIISTMVSLSASIVTGGEFDDDNLPVYQQVYGTVALAAVDYRLRYGLSENTVLEAVLPIWIKEMVRSDLAWRNGVDLLDVDDSRILQGFSKRGVRVQFVDDWQVRGAGASTSLGSATTQSAWPTSVDFLLYSAGTFILGNGMTLDLGVTRDSVLNAENDFTAAFFEEAHLVARVGHESRQYRVQISVNGNTGANAITGDNV